MALDFIPTWAAAIAQFEGFNTAGSRPARNHNPGDLKFAGQGGAVGQDPQGFAIFPDDPTGFQALYNQLTLYVQNFPGYSLLQIMAHYLGQPNPTSDAQGDAYTYAGAVASALGVTVDTTLAALAGMVGSSDPIGPTDSASGASPALPSILTGGPGTSDILLLLVAGALVFYLVNR
jgi:hypothetical protein